MNTQKRAGLIGNPINHSLSPSLHNAAYKTLGLDWEYVLYPCPSEAEFKAAIRKASARPTDVVGYNVTTPYKGCAYKVADSVDGFTSKTARAANVLTFMPDEHADYARVIGANTDGAGLIRFLNNEVGLALEKSSVLVCGTGATSAAIVIELMRARATSVTVLSRDVARAHKFVSYLADESSAFDVCFEGTNGADTSGADTNGADTSVANTNGADLAVPTTRMPTTRTPTTLTGLSYNDRDVLEACCSASSLIIDATPVGMSKDDRSFFPIEFITKRHTVFDAVYGHGETTLLREARARGARAFDGLGMLIEQAALTIEIWAAAQGLRLTVSRSVMRAAALAELELRQLKVYNE